MDMRTIIENLISALGSFDDATRVEARRAVIAMDRAAVPHLSEVLQDRTARDQLRWEAAKALVEIGDPEAMPAFLTALEDEEFDIRWLAAKGISELNVKGLEPLLQALIERGDSYFLREGAHHVFHDLHKGQLRTYLAPVMSALEGVEPALQVPGAALQALEKLKADGIIKEPGEVRPEIQTFSELTHSGTA